MAVRTAPPVNNGRDKELVRRRKGEEGKEGEEGEAERGEEKEEAQ